MQQLRDIAPIARDDLLPGIHDAHSVIGRILQFKNADGDTIHIEQNIGTAFPLLAMIGVGNGQLVHHAKDVLRGTRKIHERHLLRQPLLGLKGKAIHEPAVHPVERGEITARIGIKDLIAQTLDILHGESRIRLAQELFQIIHIDDLALRGARQLRACQVLPTRLLQHADERSFKVVFAESSVIIL